jgi:hypothetical protein
MICLHSSISLRLAASFQIVVLLTFSVGQLFAVQIAPNPNPEGNTITIAPPIPGDNFVPFTNLGVINIQAAASFQNANQFDNLGGILNTGRMTNSDVFNNNVVVSLLDGSHFHNQSTGLYSGSGGTGINGTFLNEGSVSNNLMGWHVSESGQYIQRQDAGSLITPSTVMRDGVFINEGQVSLGGGNFVNERVAGYDNRATGTTQIDARFQNSGQVHNAGSITVGTTGEYQQKGFPFPISFLGGLTANTGTFTNAGTTNIGTGIFDNQGRVENTGKIELSPEAQFIQQRQQPSAVGVSTFNAGTFTNAGSVRIGEGTTFSNFPTLAPGSPSAVGGQYIQQAGGTTQIDGTFFNQGGRVNNQGTITVGATGTYFQTRSAAPVGVTPATVNTGTFTNGGNTAVNAGTFTNQGAVVNSGAFQIGVVGSGTLDNQSNVQNAGTFQVAALGRLNNSGTFSNAGAVRIGEGATFSNFPTLGLGIPPAVGGQYIQQTGSTTQIDGTFQNNGGRVTNDGSITVGSTGSYFQTRSAAPVPASPATVNTGTFTNMGNTAVNVGPFTNQGRVVNTGTFTVEAAAQLTGNGSYVQAASAAQTIVHGSFSNPLQLQTGSLSGTGIVTGHVTQTGSSVIQPGTVRPGVLTLAGGLTQGFNGRLDFKIGGLLAGSQYDVLRVTGGSLTLNGTLSASLIDGFKPRLGNRFDLLTCIQGCSGLAGGSLFTRLSLPSLSSGLAWVTGLTGIDDGIAFSLSVVSPVVSAPEPTTLLLVGFGFVGLMAWRRKRRDQHVEG